MPLNQSLLSLVIQRLDYDNIKYKSIILHGSQCEKFASEYSDYDYVVISDKTDRDMDVFIGSKQEKIQIEFLSEDDLECLLARYEAELFMRILDTNMLAGRILSGSEVFSNHSVLPLINRYRCYKMKSKLIEKFVRQAAGFKLDSLSDDSLLSTYSTQNLFLSLGIAYLISKEHFWLAPKWQHHFVLRYLTEEDYEEYIFCRKNPDGDRQRLEGFAKRLVNLINMGIS